MPCFYCGKRISMVRQMADPDFCSEEHRRRYQDLAEGILRRLTEADPRPAARAARAARSTHASGPSVAAAAAARNPKPAQAEPAHVRTIIIPPEHGVLPGRLPESRPLLSGAWSGPVGGGFETRELSAIPRLAAPDAARREPQPFAWLRTGGPGWDAGPAPAARILGPEVFAPQPAAFGRLTGWRDFSAGARALGFFKIEPDWRRRFARHRSALAPRISSRPAVIPAGPPSPVFAPDLCVLGFAGSGTRAAVAPVLSPCCYGFENLAGTVLRLPGMRPRVAPAPDAIELIASGGLCGWRIQLPALFSPEHATALAGSAGSAVPEPALPDLGYLSPARGEIGSAVFLRPAAVQVPPVTEGRPKLPDLSRVWPAESPAFPRLSRGSGAPSAPPVSAAILFDLPQPLRGRAASAPDSRPALEQHAVRKPARPQYAGAAAVGTASFLRYGPPALKPRPAAFADVLTPPILTVSAVPPSVPAEPPLRGCAPFTFRPDGPPAAGSAAASALRPVELEIAAAGPGLPRLSTLDHQRTAPMAALLPEGWPQPRQLRSTYSVATGEVRPAAIETAVRRVRRPFRAIPEEGLLPMPARLALTIGHPLPCRELTPDAPASRLPAIGLPRTAYLPARVQPFIPVLRAQPGAATASLQDFIELRPEAAGPPPFAETYGVCDLRIQPLVDPARPALYGLARARRLASDAPPFAAPELREAASPLPPPLEREMAAPGFAPVTGRGLPAGFAAPSREAASTDFPAAIILPGRAWRFKAAGGIAAGVLLVEQPRPAVCRDLPVSEPAGLAPPEPHAPVRAGLCRFAGLKAGAFLAEPGAALALRARPAWEDWQLSPPGSVEHAALVTRSSVEPRFTPARAVVANVRLSLTGSRSRALPAQPPEIRPPAIHIAGPAASGTPGIALAGLLGRAHPAPLRNSHPGSPGMDVINLPGSAAVAVLRRTAPMARPGYPVFSFVPLETFEFDLDDEDTCILNGPVESGLPAPALPSRPPSLHARRRLGWCGAVPGEIEAAEGPRRLAAPAPGAVFTPPGSIPATPFEMPPLLPEEDYALAANEGVQPWGGWRGPTRLFR